MTVREQNTALPTAQIAALCRNFSVARLHVFGSALRSDFRKDSDVDLLVEFLPGARIGFFRFMDLQFALEKLLGRKVDLRTPAEFPERLQHHLRETAESVYVDQR